MQSAPMTDEEKRKVYMDLPKEEVVSMLIECNRILDAMKPQIIVPNNPTVEGEVKVGDKVKIRWGEYVWTVKSIFEHKGRTRAQLEAKPLKGLTSTCSEWLDECKKFENVLRF